MVVGAAIFALVVVVFLAYQPAWQGTFLWNDESDVLNNPVLKPGGLAKVWVPGGYLNYWPLTFTVFRIENSLWGLNTLGFHLVNLALHALSAILVWRILVRLRLPGALFAAALFALHPVNVESVAWITQLKSILSLTLALFSMYFYLSDEKQRGGWCYGLSIVLFLLSALAKGMAITLPAVLLACTWWQQGRVGRRDLLRVLPFVLVGALMAVVEVWTQHRVTGGEIIRDDGLLSRAAIAGIAVWFYLGKLLWPLNLCLVYPRWQIDDHSMLSYLPGVLLVMLFAAAWWQRRSWGRPLVMLIVCYVALLLPALGFVNIFFMRYSLVADHWQYAAMIAPCAAFAAAATTVVGHSRFRLLAAYVLGLALVATLATLTWRQSRSFADTETLFRTTIGENPHCWMAYVNLGCDLADRGHYQEAIEQFQQALRIHPHDAKSHNNWGRALLKLSRNEEAAAQFREALWIERDFPEAHNNWGSALMGLGRNEEAASQFREALRLKPDYSEAHYNWGIALMNLRRNKEAAAQFQEALRINPDNAECHYNLAVALMNLGRDAEAVTHFREALKIKPDLVAARGNLGNALADLGKLNEAIEQYLIVLRLNPRDALAHVQLAHALLNQGKPHEAEVHLREAVRLAPSNVTALSILARILVAQGQTEEAVKHYLKALKLQPDDASALNDLAWIRATHPQSKFRDPAQALTLARRAVALVPRNATCQDTLAAAYAEAGQFAKAIETAQRALTLASAQHDHVLVDTVEQRIKLYRAGTPYRELPQLPKP